MSTTNYIETIRDNFKKLLEKTKYDAENNKPISTNIQFKIRHYQKIVGLLKKITSITKTDDVKGLPGFGKGTLERITEIIETGSVKELNDSSITNSEISEYSKLQQITGIGPKKAKQLLNLSINLDFLLSIKDDDAKLKEYKITHHQKMGLRYFEDTQKRIPHEQISKFDKILQTIANELKISLTICGSYRRKLKTSGDIDVLATHKTWNNASKCKNGLMGVLDKLRKKQLIKDDLTASKQLKTKYMGFVKIPYFSQICRIDIRAVLYSQSVPAILYFTGSQAENIRIRNKALSLGYKLNEYGLFKIPKLTFYDSSDEEDNNQKNNNTEVKLKTEKHLYELLEEEYKKPEER